MGRLWGVCGEVGGLSLGPAGGYRGDAIALQVQGAKQKHPFVGWQASGRGFHRLKPHAADPSKIQSSKELKISLGTQLSGLLGLVNQKCKAKALNL